MSNQAPHIRKKGSFHDLKFTVDLTDYGKTGSDVSDIFFSIKADEKDTDASIFLKSLGAGEISFTGTDVLIVNVQWPETGYANFVLDKVYDAGLFLKFSGDPAADENVDRLFKIKIIQDFLVDN